MDNTNDRELNMEVKEDLGTRRTEDQKLKRFGVFGRSKGNTKRRLKAKRLVGKALDTYDGENETNVTLECCGHTHDT